MAFYEWSDKLTVDVKAFDEQHKKLIKLINDLHDAMSKGKGREVLGGVLKELITYTLTHFKNEEKVLQQYNYPNYALHLKEHEALAVKATALSADFEKRQLTLSMEVMNFLKDWLNHHILETDKQYGAFFKEKGITL